MPAKEPLPRRSSKAETGALRKFGDNVRSRREAQDLSSSTLRVLRSLGEEGSLPAVSLPNPSNGQEQLAERTDLDRTYICRSISSIPSITKM